VQPVKRFWYYSPAENFPPPSIRWPGERHGGDRLAIACTQTNLPRKQQQQLVDTWCQELPKLSGIRWLWLNSRVPQALFDAACRVKGLEGLWVKWVAATSITALSNARAIRYLHLGNCAGVASFDGLAELDSLVWLGIEHFPKIRNIDSLGRLTELVGLTVEGSISVTQRIGSIAPLRNMVKLRYLSLAAVRVEDKSLAPLAGMRDLEVLILPRWWDESAVERVRQANPKLVS
jgi:hypothetical protein